MVTAIWLITVAEIGALAIHAMIEAKYLCEVEGSCLKHSHPSLNQLNMCSIDSCEADKLFKGAMKES